MPEEEVGHGEGTPDAGKNGREDRVAPARRRRYFTRRNLLFFVAGAGILAIILALFTVVTYKFGVYDNYIRAQLVDRFAAMGMVFNADVFRVTINPLDVELKNATFTDKTTGELLFSVRDAHLRLSIKDLFSWQLSRDISLDSTEVNGAEVWVKFDDNGRSNFSNLKFVEEERGRINFTYESVNFALRDAVVHVGDLSRKIDANAKNVAFFLEPVDLTVPDEQKRYKINFSSSDSDFSYDGHQLEKIGVSAKGIADHSGAEISELNIKTPIGESTLSGTVNDWASLKYDLNIESNVDLTQASTIFPLGTAIRGVGNFKGHVTGEGETYKIEGQVDSESIMAEGVYLKGLNVEATVQGVNSTYDANGKAIAELLTFEDFRVDYPKLTGKVHGTGTDFRWVGELEAIAAKTPSLTLAGLFLSDAVADYQDRKLALSAGKGTTKRFDAGDVEFDNLMARNLKFAQAGNGFRLTSPSATSGSLKSKDYALNGVSAGDVEVKHVTGRTDVTARKMASETAQIKGARARDVSADDFQFIDLPRSTSLTARNLRVAGVDTNGVSVTGVETPQLNIDDNGAETVIYSDKVRVAKIDAKSAVLGSLNIAGVRLTIKQGTVSGRTDDIDAGNVQITKASGIAGGGNLDAVKIAKPVFVLEPSGRYRASADMSIGGGVLGQVNLGAARADVDVNNDRVALNNLTAQVMNGDARGTAIIGLNNRAQSQITGDFTNLDVGKLLALQSGRVIPLNGETTGTVNLTFNGTDLRNASGNLTADITANA